MMIRKVTFKKYELLNMKIIPLRGKLWVGTNKEEIRGYGMVLMDRKICNLHMRKEYRRTYIYFKNVFDHCRQKDSFHIPNNILLDVCFVMTINTS